MPDRPQGSEYQTIRYTEAGGVGKLTLARPAKRNAQNPRMWAELRDLGAQLQARGPLHCLVVAGDGPVFSAGIDLAEGLSALVANLADQPDDDQAVRLGLQAVRSFSWISKLGCSSLALVQGHAYGAGLQLALACDFRVFTETAQVGVTETRYGLLPDMGAAWRLPQQWPWRRGWLPDRAGRDDTLRRWPCSSTRRRRRAPVPWPPRGGAPLRCWAP